VHTTAPDVSKASAQAFAQTALHAAVQMAEVSTWEENQKIVQEVEWYAELDRRTCLLCVSLDREVFPVKEAPRPPIHVRCRCFLYPYWPEYENWLTKSMGWEKQAQRITRLGTEPRTVHHRDGTTSTAFDGYDVKFGSRHTNYREWMQSMVNSRTPRTWPLQGRPSGRPAFVWSGKASSRLTLFTMRAALAASTGLYFRAMARQSSSVRA
jgi:SPP1 gp7 family putative phage head morphogenesis protein